MLSHALGARVRAGKAWEGWGGGAGQAAGCSWVLLRAKGVCRLSLQPQSRRGWAVQGWEKGGAGRCTAGERWSWARPLLL